MNAARPSRRRSRSDEQERRDRRITVRLNDDEYAHIAARAEATGMTPSSYLAMAGMEVLAGSSGSHLSLPQLRALVAELYALKRILRGSGNNLNQLTRIANANGEVPDEAWHHVARLAHTDERVTQLLNAVGPELVPRGDEQ